MKWGSEVFETGAKKALAGKGEYAAGNHCRFCKARFTCRERTNAYLRLAQMEFREVVNVSTAEADF